MGEEEEDLRIEIHRLEANIAQLGELVTQNFISLLEIKEQIISVKSHLEKLEKEEKSYRKNFNHLIILTGFSGLILGYLLSMIVSYF